jgi:hypothetical protein
MDPDGYVLAAGVTNQLRCDGRMKHQDGVKSFDSVLCSTGGDPDVALPRTPSEHECLWRRLTRWMNPLLPPCGSDTANAVHILRTPDERGLRKELRCELTSTPPSGQTQGPGSG